MGTDGRVAVLRGTDLFGSLSMAALRALAAELEPVELRAGDVLCREGEPGDRLFVVAHGRLEAIRVGSDGTEAHLSESGPGEVVGELGVVSDRPRFATVRAVRDTELLALSRPAFERVVAHRPKVLLDLVQLLVGRLTGPARAARARARTVALVPAGATPSADVAGFARALVRTLRPEGAVALLDESWTGAAGTPTEVAAALDDAERRAQVVVLVAGPTRSAWAEACTRHADRILLIADAGTQAAAPNAAEGADGLAARELVLLHPTASVRWPGSSRWFDGRTLRAHHLVRRGSAADLRRLARSLLGRSVGVVLSGGGPRGFAHLGVLRALDEAGIPVDSVGGTSIGSLMAAGAAFDWSHDEALERVAAALGGRGSLLRPTLPIVALSSGRRVEALLRDDAMLGDRHLEDALRPWFCVSASLDTASVVVHDQGSAWLAVRASIALPGILPPVARDGELLVDGGVLDNLPVDVMRRRVDGPIVAVDLEPEATPRPTAAFPPSVTGWSALGHRVRHRSGEHALPSTLSVLMRSRQVGVRHLQTAILEANPVELYLRPPLGEIGALEFKGADRLVEVGYRYAVDALTAADLSAFPPR